MPNSANSRIYKIAKLHKTSIRKQLELPFPELDFSELEKTFEDLEDYALIRNIPFEAITMVKSQGDAILRHLRESRPSMTDGYPELFYDTRYQQLIIEDGNHRIFQAYIDGDRTFDGLVRAGGHSDYAPVYDSKDKFEWGMFPNEEIIEAGRVNKIAKLHKVATTDIVYHKTSIWNAAKILKENKIMTSVAFGTEADNSVNKGYPYYLSTMRSTYGDYGVNSMSVFLELDGRSLNDNLKSFPIDYWGPSFPTDEMEERFATTSPYVEPADRFINSIHILGNISSDSWGHKYSDTRVEELRSIIKNAEDLGVESYLYLKEADFKSLNKRASITFDEWLMLVKMDEEKNLTNEPDLYTREEVPDSKILGFARIIEAIKSGDSSGIDKSHHSEWYLILYYAYEQERMLAAAIHNNKSKPESRGVIHAIYSEMKRIGAKDLRGLIDHLHEGVTLLKKKDKPIRKSAQASNFGHFSTKAHT